KFAAGATATTLRGFVLEDLSESPFESLESRPDRILTLKVTLLLAVASIKHIEVLQALS
ncbi:hypothetical protein M9458_025978, partial [Cirrhinus mrigala]